MTKEIIGGQISSSPLNNNYTEVYNLINDLTNLVDVLQLDKADKVDVISQIDLVASNIVNDTSGIEGTKVSNALLGLRNRINNIDELGVNADIALYNMEDLVNVDNYVSNEYDLTLFKGYTIALFVENTNTGASTLDVGDVNGAVGIKIIDDTGTKRDVFSDEIYSWNIMHFDGTHWILLDKTLAINTKIGDRTELTTDIKTSIVNAINELDSVKSEVTSIYTRTEIDGKDDELAGVGRTTETIKANQDEINTHKTNVLNPHGTTATQVGAYSKTEMQTSGQSNMHYDNLTNVPNLADDSWKPPVDLYGNLPTVGNSINDTRIVADDIDSLETTGGGIAIYICVAITGTVGDQWDKVADLDFTNDHGALVGLNDDDHTQYLRHDGTRVMSDNLDMNNNQILNMILQQTSIAPTIEGTIYYDPDEHEVKVKKATGVDVISGQGSIIRRVEITAISSQTIFDVGQSGTYSYETNANLIDVFIKNASGRYELLDADDYTETDSETITLDSPATVGEEYLFKWNKNLSTIASAIEANSITNNKLGTDIKIGSLADLNTVDKTKVISAINEVLSGRRTDENIQDVVGGFLNGGTDISVTYDDTGNQLTVSFTGNYQPAGTYNTVIGTDTDVNTSGATIIDNIFMTDGVVTSHGTRNLTLANLGYTGATNANYYTYTHPNFNGDDIDLDTGALSGATVISDLNFNITTDTNGHVVDANGTYSTRNLNYNDVGALADHETAVNSDKVDGYHITKNGAGGAGIINYIT
jgi:hypothetical protein